MVEAETVERWAGGLRVLGSRIGRCFERAEPRQRAVAYLRGLMSEVQRKNGWQLAEEAGKATPDRMQRLLSTAVWDVDGVRDDLREYVLETLGSGQGGVGAGFRSFLHLVQHNTKHKTCYTVWAVFSTAVNIIQV